MGADLASADPAAAGPATPSAWDNRAASAALRQARTDAEQAFWPDAVYLIVSLAGGGADLKGYLIGESGITEEPIEIV